MLEPAVPAELWNVAGEFENENRKATNTWWTHAHELDLYTSFCCNYRSFFHTSDPPLFMALPRHVRPLQRTPPCKAILVGHAQYADMAGSANLAATARTGHSSSRPGSTPLQQLNGITMFK